MHSINVHLLRSSENISHTRSKVLAEACSRIALIKSLCHHNRICKKIWGSVARCYGFQCDATGAFRLPDAAAPMGFNDNDMADTTNATFDGGIDVPHCSLSGAKISIISETAKLSSIFFLDGTKNKGTQAMKTCVPFVLSYYNNYVSLLQNTNI